MPKISVKNQNPVFTKIGKDVINSFAEVRKINDFTAEMINTIFEVSGDKKVFLSDELDVSNELRELMIAICSIFNTPYDCKIKMTLIDPPDMTKDKKKTHILPCLPEDAFYRIVYVSGSHEIFQMEQLKSLFSNVGVLVPTGSAIKINKDFGKISYDNKGTYDVNLYPGRGIKRPEKRRIILFDLLSSSEEDIKKVQIEEIKRASQRLVETGGSYFNKFLKTFKDKDDN